MLRRETGIQLNEAQVMYAMHYPTPRCPNFRDQVTDLHSDDSSIVLSLASGGLCDARSGPQDIGVRVLRINLNRPVGLLPGDIILLLNGAPVRSPDQLLKSIRNLPESSDIHLIVARGDRKVAVSGPRLEALAALVDKQPIPPTPPKPPSSSRR